MKADIKEYNLAPEILKILLLDRTTQHNILWGCEDYAYPAISPIEFSQIIDGTVIIPRFEKTLHISYNRKKKKAEVFTPIEIVKLQNDMTDKCFSGKWDDYVKQTVLEVTCGEAPYLVNRYDVSTGETLLLRERQGLLDRKLAQISNNISEVEQWKQYALIALKATYGFEWQGDSLLLARENILEAWKDYFCQKFPQEPITLEEEKEVAKIISYNIFQMNGITGCIPYSNIPAKVMNWETNNMEYFNPNIGLQLNMF